MPDTISHMTAVPQNPEERGRQNQRIEQAVSKLSESPACKKVFVADEERDGITQVTFASKISADRISITEIGFKDWNPERFQSEINSRRHLS